MKEQFEEKVRQRAYEIWEEQGRPDDRQDEHWHLACKDVYDQEPELVDSEGTTQAVLVPAVPSGAGQSGVERVPNDPE